MATATRLTDQTIGSLMTIAHRTDDVGPAALRADEARLSPIAGGYPRLGWVEALGMGGLDPARNPVPAVGGRIGDGASVTDDQRGGWPPVNARAWRHSDRIGA